MTRAIWWCAAAIAMLVLSHCGGGVGVGVTGGGLIDTGATLIANVAEYREAAQCQAGSAGNATAKGWPSIDLPDIDTDALADEFQQTLDDLQRTVTDRTQSFDLSATVQQALTRGRSLLASARPVLQQLRTQATTLTYPVANFVGETLADDSAVPNENLFDRLHVRARRDPATQRITVQVAETDVAGVANETITPEQILIEGLNATGDKIADVTDFEFSHTLADLASQSADALTILTVNDYSGSMKDDLDRVEQALGLFYDVYPDALQTEVIKFTHETHRWYPLGPATGATFETALTSRPTLGGTALYDAVTVAISDVCSGNGWRALLLMTDGQDNASEVTLDETIALAQAQHVPIFVLGFGYANKQVLKRLAEETGGAYVYFPYATYQALGAQTFETAYQLMAGVLNYTYRVSFADLPSGVTHLRVSYQSSSTFRVQIVSL